MPPAKEQKKRFEKKDRRRCLFILRSPTYGGGSERKVGINVTSFERQNFLWMEERIVIQEGKIQQMARDLKKYRYKFLLVYY